jgi:hypothetical protein
MRRTREDGVEFGALLRLCRIGMPVKGDIARRLGPELRRARQRRARDIGDGVTRRVIDLYPLGRVARRRFAVGDHQRHRVADMAHALADERRAVRHDHAGSARHRYGDRHAADARLIEIGLGQHREHAGPGARRRNIDAADIGKSVRRPDEDSPGRVRRRVVVLEPAGAYQQRTILVARHEIVVHPGSPMPLDSRCFFQRWRREHTQITSGKPPPRDDFGMGEAVP